ncbi:hypothetical protein PR048_017337, partial [Dryococelus australis]
MSSNATTPARLRTAKDILCTFIDNIPKLPSHDCRRSRTKQYIGPIYGDNVSGLYREYSRQCQKKTPPVKPLSRFTFENVVHCLRNQTHRQNNDLPHRTSRNEAENLCDFPQLRNEPIKIKYKKWQHLKELKKVIPVDCGPFYDSVPHKLKPAKAI